MKWSTFFLINFGLRKGRPGGWIFCTQGFLLTLINFIFFKLINFKPRTPPLEDHDHRQLLSSLPSLIASTKNKINLNTNNNGLSGAEVIELVQPLGIPLDAIEAVAGLQRFLEERCIEQIEMEKRRQGNIKVFF